MKLFKMGKNVKTKIIIWHMVGEMVKKWGGTRLYLSCSYSCRLFFLVNILLVKLKNLHNSACLLESKLWHSKNVKSGEIYQTL